MSAAISMGVSLYPKHIKVVEQVAETLEISDRPRHFSQALQRIIEDYASRTANDVASVVESQNLEDPS
jgi:hypothetical protein